MGKAKLGLLLAGAYAFGVVVLAGIALALPCGTLPRVRVALDKVPVVAHRAVLMTRAAVHAGSLGVKHLPAVLEPQGLLDVNSQKYCLREVKGGRASRFTILPVVLQRIAPVVRVMVVTDDEG